MSLFFDDSRNKQDVDEVFSHIYYDLLSIHPSNEYFRIFLQYFQPLFDLSFGIVFPNFGDAIIPSFDLPFEEKQILRGFHESFKIKMEPAYFNCSNWDRHGLQNFDYIVDAKSCFIIPVKIIGCFKKSGKYNYKGSLNVGSIYLFSRLKLDKFDFNNPLEYIYSQVSACFLQQSARAKFLINSEKYQRTCILKEPICDGKGLDLLNKAGTQLWQSISAVKKA